MKSSSFEKCHFSCSVTPPPYMLMTGTSRPVLPFVLSLTTPFKQSRLSFKLNIMIILEQNMNIYLFTFSVERLSYVNWQFVRSFIFFLVS